ncbi:hypothetical protein FISHEDRAFT_54434 [Fistulina hepatica ATCC 64428]|uniref:GATA-type domain-containing protein n=1 Tax=Fistulina hepatica ATCC 64428 TaxID=1128425 RepID=A0A0D7A1X7_9AGAR|nr:hypothetical protein FISHEDRAFT_54434 [Fistulina hepatica ATCC 64428]
MVSASSQSDPHRYAPLPFDFTKRKRWADILIHELADVIVFILSVPTCKILFCGVAIEEILGYRDVDVLDTDMAEFINVDDRAPFHAAFSESVRTRTDMLAYVRLICNSNPPGSSGPQTTTAAYWHDHQYYQQQMQPPTAHVREILFEITGYAHFVEPDGPSEPAQCKCFFAMARPYPSKNTAMLNTFLELKMENRKLEHRINELRMLHQQQRSAAAEAGPSSAVELATPSYGGQNEYDPNCTSYDTRISSAMLGYPSASHDFVSSGLLDDEVGQAKKKRKKGHNEEQHVCITCGRTDSPEWRKGPLGPKTLCNACGLRWAKQIRKGEEGALIEGVGNEAGNGN